MAEAGEDGLRFQLRHTMIPVGDLDRSVDFYHRLFGMTVLRRRPDEGDGRTTAYVGYGGEQDSTVLELIAGTGDKAAPWAGHIAISVSDLTALCERLKAEGVRFSKPLRAVSGGTRRFTANVYDPDGIELELSEPRAP
jgi:lactoylglutathione lyase